ncbi:PAS domain-containing protein, partial [Streptomyces carpinensis]
MAERGAPTLSLPDDWPVHPDPILALNRMGSFDWDLDTGLLGMDAMAHRILDITPEEYDGHPGSLDPRLTGGESERLDALVARAMKDGSENYGTYLRLRRRDGSLRWAYVQGCIRRDASGRPRRIIGILRDATRELEDGVGRRQREALDAARREQTNVVQVTTAALAHARTVQDVIDVVKDSHGLALLGSTSLVLGLLEAGRLRLVAEGPAGSSVPGTEVTRVDDPYPLSEAVRTLRPRFIESPEEFADCYPILWPHITGLDITSAAYLPLIAQARPIGGMGLLYSGRHGFTQEERNVLVALGSSIAQSLQRAMLYEQEKDLAQGLQQAMLPRTIPSVPGADVAVRYRSGYAGGSLG